MSKKFVPPPEDDSSGEINTIFSDLITFIMALFILLFVLSYQEEPQFSTFFSELRLEFGGEIEKSDKPLKAQDLFVNKLSDYLKTEKLEDQARVQIEEDQIRIILSPPVLFDSGKAKIKPEGKKILTALGNYIKETTNPIAIEGHTDNVPIHNDDYDSNWDLSFGRAYSVLKVFINDLEYDPQRISCQGFGEYRPLAPNTTRENRQKNRRIEINIKRDYTSKFVEVIKEDPSTPSENNTESKDSPAVF